METRELFWEISSLGHTLFFVVAGAAMAVCAAGVVWHVWRYARARRSPVPVHPWRGFWRMVFDLVSQRTVRRRDRAAGHAHTPIMYGFLLLLAATSIITVEYDISEPFFGFTFWHGPFYLAFSLIADLAGLGLIAGVLYMMWRRWKVRPQKLVYRRAYRGETEERPLARAWLRDDALFLWALLLIGITGFLQEGVRLAMDQPAWGPWSPVGWVLAQIFLGLGMDESGAAAVRRANWWIHGVASLAFIAAIPWTKAKHVIAVLGSLSTRDVRALSRLPRPASAVAAETAADDDEPEAGFGSIAEFSWKDLLNLDACTKCGRCHEACPATASGAPLSPRDLILDLRNHAARSAFRLRGDDDGPALIGEVIEAETLWSCRSCGACMEICPVGIEHPPMIVQMRRRLVEDGAMEQQLRDTLDMIANRGNSFGEPPRARGGWTAALEFPVKDVREEPAEHLWFVGDYASYDPRNQDVSRTVARLFRAAGLDFGLLYEAERTAGNDVRRVGEEGLFESLAEHNLEAMGAARQFEAIVTTDPHSYNTIRNEYPDYGDVAPIRHYSSVLAELLESGRLSVTKPLGKRVTLHDPCHLGRLNGHYDEPRRVLELIGCELVDMPRCRDNSFCCGAGGGRIWMPDPVGKEKPSENRMHEAASLGNLDAFVVCCPKDMTMFEDARKTSGHEGDFVVQDLAELVAEAIDLKSIDLAAMPALVDRITEAAAVRIADAVADRLADRLADTVAEKVASQLADSAPALAAAAAAAVPAPAPVEPSPEPGAPAPAAGAWRAEPVTAATLPPYEVPAKEGPRVLVAVKRVGELNPDFAIDEVANTIADEHFEHEPERVGRGGAGRGATAHREARGGRGGGGHNRPGGCRGHAAAGARQGRAPGRPGLGRDAAGRGPRDRCPRARGRGRAGAAGHRARRRAVGRSRPRRHGLGAGPHPGPAARGRRPRHRVGRRRGHDRDPRARRRHASAARAPRAGAAHRPDRRQHAALRHHAHDQAGEEEDRRRGRRGGRGPGAGGRGGTPALRAAQDRARGDDRGRCRSGRQDHRRDHPRETGRGVMAGILVVAEHFDGALRDVTLEMIGAAAAVKEELGGPLALLLIAQEPQALADAANREGVDEIVTVASPDSHFDPALYEEAAAAVAEARQARLVLIGHTAAGMAFGPAVAARLGSGFAADVFGLAAEAGGPVVTRGGFGGKVQMDLAFPGKPVVVLTLRGATFKPPAEAGSASIVPFDIGLDAVAGASRHIDYVPAPPADVDIGKAEFILSVGRALGEDKNLSQFAALAERLGATLGCSRPVADSGWLPKAHQVGQSGTIAANCSLYLALGISGAVQHLAGMKHVDTIIAVNTDPEAPIFNVAHHGACVDIFELAEALEREFN